MAKDAREDDFTFYFVFGVCSFFFIIVSFGFIRSQENWNDCFRFLDHLIDTCRAGLCAMWDSG